MAKRKRAEIESRDHEISRQAEHLTPVSSLIDNGATIDGKQEKLPETEVIIQLVTGSYERVLHGVMATISLQDNMDAVEPSRVTFTDTFLFNAHGSAIRCLAISPPSASSNASMSQKAILASGSSDQIINLYHIATSPPLPNERISSLSSLGSRKIVENSRNRELGSLQHHSSSINVLHFPTRSKLLSAAEDNTIAVTRTRDWTVLSTIKVPIPKAHGRPSGDTAPLGGTPVGVNDFAVHPSMKLMVSVSKGEKCMRLWNLVTGKKAGVLNFDKQLLRGIGEGRWGNGEGRRVQWNTLGEEFAVGFERGAVVFGMDSKPRCRIFPSPLTKIHQLRYIEISNDHVEASEFLAISTEDGRIIFYDTKADSTGGIAYDENTSDLQTIEPFAQIGGIGENTIERIKDFEILDLSLSKSSSGTVIAVAGSSDGSIRLWRIDKGNLLGSNLLLKSNGTSNGSGVRTDASMNSTIQLARLIGTYETGNRITCLKAFVMPNSGVPSDA